MSKPVASSDALRKLAHALRETAQAREKRHFDKCAQAVRAASGLGILRRKLELTRGL